MKANLSAALQGRDTIERKVARGMATVYQARLLDRK